MHALDATKRRAAITILGAAAALTLAPGPRAQAQGGDERPARRDSIVVRLRASSAEQARLRARIESLLSKYNADQLSASDRARISGTIDSLVMAFAELARNGAVVGAGMVEGGGMSGAFAETRPSRAPRRIEVHRGDLSPDDYVLKGWIGINAQGIQLPPRFRDGEIYLKYMEYPKVVTVDANSPAARAGILKGDLLVAYDGADLRENEINLTRLLQPLRQIRVTVDRDGDRHDYPLVVAKAPQSLLVRRMESGLVQFDDTMPPPARVLAGPRRGGAGGRGTIVESMARGGVGGGARGGRILVAPADPSDTMSLPVEPPRFFFMRSFGDGLLGAQAAVVDAELGESFGVDAGVLLTHVAESSPA
jgi:membrane-associated protease RseP (regulator of RpoE activity)